MNILVITFWFLMAENKTKQPISISVMAKCDLKFCSFHGIDSDDLVKIVQELNAPSDLSAIYLTIPAKSKCVIGSACVFSTGTKLEKQPKKPEINFEYWIWIFEKEMKKKTKWEMELMKSKEVEKYMYINTIYKPITIE
ncbi:hypothetical protein CRE_04404 [Caenorhabditis remanei]|uniref:Uncharacterized protein n=1 Tax=Caenorhabditis remanei TaxID=31234 RepID=E3NM45_CAERE|nr:hypothetical protein CRE_04404 [Caenorhabditis remanei]